MHADEPDPQVQAVLDTIAASGVENLSDFDVGEARTLFESMSSAVTYDADVETEDDAIDGPGGDLPIRIYRPADAGAVPTTVFVHGGGFTVGSIDSHDALATAIADRVGTVVVSLDYRLAPEHPFPAPVHDTLAGLAWARDNLDSLGGTDDVLVAGDSAGGTLSAVASLLSREPNRPDVDYQVLFYPATSPGDEWPSIEDPSTGLFLSKAEMAWFDAQYIADPLDAANPYAYPLNACDLAGLPPATVVTAGFDPLHDQGIAYVEAMETAGVPVAAHDYPAMVHGFVSMLGQVDAAVEAIDAVADDVANALA